MAEAHPVGFQWVVEAKARGARVIHIDPRFTRTSALADTLRADPGRQRHRVPRRRDQLHPGQRAGLPGVRRCVHQRGARSSPTTSATPRTWTGCSPASTRTPASTTTSSWQYQGTSRGRRGDDAELTGDRRPLQHESRRRAARRRGRGEPDDRRCSTPTASTRSSSGTSPATPRSWSSRSAACRRSSSATSARPGRPTRAGSAPPRWSTAVGWTQHSVGVQYIRAGAIIQLLLGNIGPPRRRHPGAARARQHPGLHRHPHAVQPAARLPADAARRPRTTTSRLVDDRSAAASRRASGATPTPTWCRCSRSTGASTPPPRTTTASTTCPGSTGDHGTYRTVMDMVDGEGRRATSCSARTRRSARRTAGRSGSAWRTWTGWSSATSHDRERHVLEGRARRSRPARSCPRTAGTEVFFFPAAVARGEGGHVHPDRSGMLQWREKAVDPPGDQRSELWFFYHLGRMIQRAARGLDATRATAPMLELNWDYPHGARRMGEPRRRGGAAADQRLRRWPPASRCRRLPRAEGRRLHGLRLLDLLRASSRTGSTRPRAASRAASRPGRAEWGWAWPANRRVLYNRASADPEGKPWSERKKLVWWDADRASGPATTSRTSRRPRAPARTGRRGPTGGRRAAPVTTRSSCRRDGKAWLYAPNGLLDGPLPTHYEPAESPVRNPLYGQQGNPTAQGLRAGGQPVEPEPAASRSTRRVPVRASPPPAHRAPHRRWDEPPAAVPVGAAARAVRRGLARSWPPMRGLTHLGWCHVVTSRAVDAGAGARSPTGWPPLRVDGHVVHQVWMPYHWGGERLVDRRLANDLFGVVAGPERAHPGEQGRAPATSGRARGRAARR